VTVVDNEGMLRVNRSLRIPLDELDVRTTTSSGPGGQHANRSQTRVEVRFDVAASPSLGPRQRARLLERLGPVVRARAGDERSQTRNRQKAFERLADRIADALHVATPRTPTRPTAAARARRVDTKRRRGGLKESRRRPGVEE
jgi:ribosome-associated protein